MREIKFRMWWHEKMTYTSPLEKLLFEDGHYYTHGGTDDPYILMQFTGLKDKNGKEIYEGDIVSGREGVQIGEVKFGQYQRPPQSKHDRPDWNLGWYVQGKNRVYSLEELEWYIKPTNYAPVRGSYLEVIGNIYEHPGMLQSSN